MIKYSETTLLKKNHKEVDPVFQKLLTELDGYCTSNDEALIRKAYDFGMKAHLQQRRHSGEPYFLHCVEVSRILAELRMDMPTIVAGLLHDVVEDTGITMEELKDNFGETVALLVDGVTKISSLKFQIKEARQAETFRKMLLSMAMDIRVIIIKFADRLHNMRTLHHVPAKKRPRIARETRDVYAPLAHRLGIARIKSELEDLALKYLEPDVYKDIAKKIKLSQEERDAYIHMITEPIEAELEKHQIKAQISGRPKSFFSIHNKMVRRNRPFDEIYDLLAIRIIVDKVEECYYALGIVHSKYMPVYDRFKDYIAMPKINGYQSLHTTVVGPDGRMVEIQIRTKEMHRMAEEGIAAHWKYKEGVVRAESRFEQHLAWVKELLERQMQEEDPVDFMEHLKINLYQDEVFVFTPAGDLIKLAVGSTPVDFAYAVHTNIGNHCIAAKVNGKLVPLRTELKSGQQVEIITSKNQKPSQDWLSFVKTSKARHWIKKILREEQKAQMLEIGKEVLNKFLKKVKLDIDSPQFLEALPKLGFTSVESLQAAIGHGDIAVDQIAKKLFPDQEQIPEAKDSFFVKFLKRARSKGGIRVQGMNNILIHFAKCCQPVPGDRIIGYLSRGKGVTIHRTDCKNMIKLYEEPERILEVEWDIEEKQRFQVHLSILGEDRKSLLRDITLGISKQDVNIITVHFQKEDIYARGNLNIEIQDLQHLTKLINLLRKIPGILSVERVESVDESTTP